MSKFSDRSARFVNRHGPGLPTSTSSKNGFLLIVGGQPVLWFRGGCLRKQAEYSCLRKPATRLLLICSIVRRLAPRPRHGWSCRSISPNNVFGMTFKIALAIAASCYVKIVFGAFPDIACKNVSNSKMKESTISSYNNAAPKVTISR